MRCHQSGRNITMYLHHGGVRVEQAKALPIVDNVDVFAIRPKMTNGVLAVVRV